MGVFLYVLLTIVVIGCAFLVFFIYRRLRNKIRRKKIERIMGTKLTGSDQAIIETAREFGIYFDKEEDEEEDEDVQFVFFKKDLPFTPSRFQIIYVEDEYDSKTNEYIKANFAKINTLLAASDYQFCYIPYGSANNEAIKYYYPNLTDKDIIIDNSHLTTYQDLFLYTTKGTPLKAGFICYYDEDVENDDEIDDDADWDSISLYKFAYLEISQYPELSIEELLLFYINEKSYRPDRFNIGKFSPNDYADYNFDYAAQQLIDEIRERVEKLKQLGVNEMILKSLITGEQQLSKLVISKDYKIYLPDYNNKEIILYPLVKSVFFLFLRHPEGILFKNLPDYKNELKDIYLKISNRELLDDIEQSIESVTNPTKNSINEKCSRIREAFIKEFDESLAQYYFITGERNTPKKINLDRKLVTWEMEI